MKSKTIQSRRSLLLGTAAVLVAPSARAALTLTGAGGLPAFPAPLLSAPLTANLTLIAGNGSLTLTRATAGSYIASGGNITQASSGVGRFTYNSRGETARGIIISPAVTNNIKQSQTWTVTWSSSATDTANNIVAPDGTTTGSTITQGGSATNIGYTQFVGLSISTKYSLSSFFYPGTSFLGGIELAEQFNNVASINQYPSVNLTTHLPYWYAGTSGVVLDARVVEYSGGWMRLQVKLTTPGSGLTSDQRISMMNAMAQTGSYPGNFPAGASIGFWGAQLTTGTATSPYFPTVGAAVTQNADVLSITTTTNIPASKNDFTVALEWTPTDWNMGTVYLWGSYVDANNSTQILHDGTNLIARRRISGTNHDATIPVTYSAWAMQRICATFSSTAGTQIYAQGVAGTADATTTACQIAATMQIGADGNGANQANSAIANVSTYSGAVSAATAALWVNETEYVLNNIFSGSLAIPAKFLGMHAHFWPNGASTAPTFGFGATRSVDYGPVGGGTQGLSWYYIEPNADGVYTWTNLDQWVATHKGLGHDIIYTLYGTPTGYAEFTGTNDGYGHNGGASPTTAPGLIALAAFITAMFTRYNTLGGGYPGAAPGTIKYLEVWNEPTYGSGGSANTPSNSTSWWGTNGQLAVQTKAIAAAAKLVDSTVQILGPASAIYDGNPYNTSSSFYLSLIGNDGAASTLAAHLDLVSHHGYQSFLYQDRNFTLGDIGIVNDLCSKLCVAAGLAANFPRIMSEIGYDTTPGTAPLLNMTPTEMASWLIQTAVAYAMLGYQKCCFYGYDDALIGDPMTQPIISSALDFINNNLAGTTLLTVQLVTSGQNNVQMKVTTSIGAFYITSDIND